MEANKIKYGLKNVHYAKITETAGRIVYAVPKPIPGAVSISLPPAGEKSTFEADDSVYFEENVNNGYEGDLEIALIPDSFKQEIFGETVDANGLLVENSDAVQSNFALLFEFSGDKQKTRHILYNCSASRSDVAGKTKGKSVDPQTDKLKLSARPALDTKDVKGKIAQGSPAYESFFSAVLLKNNVINEISDDSVSFSKSAGDDLTISGITPTANAIVNATMDGVSIGGVYLTVSGVNLTISKAYLSSLENGAYKLMIYLAKGNAVTVTVTVTE